LVTEEEVASKIKLLLQLQLAQAVMSQRLHLILQPNRIFQNGVFLRLADLLKIEKSLTGIRPMIQDHQLDLNLTQRILKLHQLTLEQLVEIILQSRAPLKT
jgi:hypothetical protein